ncbi:hypothetical protein M427DRAFT_440211 [Gonapodya prolifera JEL478]|uniref:Extracellular membrane protein CFEM domain-containing protein n=1 Tax=Gonapodya prolifera (strain JEL478) TaxID=1344416 RepID=A0A139A3P7_GONPJ|nr:hypothetical protein M427DRAFT_440211 [Gonapodya prolifera JEL478]|eukprot:KXS11248.1 hypothetical protein M427DRAFT_440211 [Gonapodya prolifera JEL478]
MGRWRPAAFTIAAALLLFASSVTEVQSQGNCTSKACQTTLACVDLPTDEQFTVCVCSNRQDFVTCRDQCLVVDNLGITDARLNAVCGSVTNTRKVTSTARTSAAPSPTPSLSPGCSGGLCTQFVNTCAASSRRHRIWPLRLC